MAILTNRLSVSIDYEKFDRSYDLFEIAKDDGGKISWASRALEPIDAPYILSILGQAKGKPFYILAKHDSVTVQELRNHFEQVFKGDIEGENLESKDVGNHLMPQKIPSSLVETHALVQLLLNALVLDDREGESFQNVTGHLYCLGTTGGRIKRNKTSGRCYQVVALEIKVTPKLFLTANVRTFTRANASGLVFDTKKPESYPKYVMDFDGPSMRRLAPGEKPSSNDVFIPKQYEGDKNRVPFLQYKSMQAFNDSKCGLIREIMQSFNDRYTGVARISFAPIDESRQITAPGKLAEVDFAKSFSEHPWAIVDVNHDAAGLAACNAIADWLAKDELLGKRPQIELTAQPGANNLLVIHEPGYYKSARLEDPYKTSAPEDCICQRITIEKVQAELGKDDKSSNLRFLLPRCLLEDEIKRDIRQRKMTLYNWSLLDYGKPLVFACAGPESKEEKKARKRDDAPNRYSFLEVSPNGELSFNYGHVDSASDGTRWDEYACELAGAWCCSTDGFVIDNYDDIDVIESTDGFPVPNLDYVHSCIEGIDWALPKQTILDIMLHDTGDPAKDKVIGEMRRQVAALSTPKVKSGKLNALIKDAVNARQGTYTSRAFRKLLDERLEDALALNLQTCVPRNAEAIKKGYESMVGMHCIWDEDSLLYWTDRFNGLDQTGRENGSVIRRVRNLQGGRPFFADLLGTLTIPIARLNSPSVLPLPFKYLREWMGSINVETGAWR